MPKTQIKPIDKAASAGLYDAPFVLSILHPTDFSEPSAQAFAHALAIALARKTEFTLLHVAKGKKTDWHHFPGVRSTLERWKILEKGSSPADVFEKLGMRVQKVGIKGADPANAILGYLKDHVTDLIVLSTEGREGIARWVQPSLAERVNRNSKTMTLFVPEKSKGFVDRQTGQLSLRKILVPVDYQPSPLPALEYAARVARAAGNPVEIVIMYVKSQRPMPAIDVPEIASITWTRKTVEGEVVETLLQACKHEAADLLVMATAGHEGFLDALRGGTTDQVVRQSPCPVLAVPVTRG